MLMKNVHLDKNELHVMPEIMWGVSKKIMFHSEAFFSDNGKEFDVEGAGVYIKYRFYSQDEVHSHLRFAAFARYSLNNSLIHDASLNLNGMNSGYEGGLVSTKLINKVAISASTSFIRAMDNGKFVIGNDFKNALNYTLSAGKLMLPKEYTSYDQPNLNLMLELLGQTNLGNNKQYYFDMAPSVQLILKSKMRIDFGYRFPLVDKMYRARPNTAQIRFEYNFFNAY